MKKSQNTIGWNAKDYIDFLSDAIDSGEKKRILEAYDLIQESDVDFSDIPSFLAEEYDELVEKGNSILGI